ncbi:MAG: Polyhydroxyalkanoate synthase [Rhodospirillales bacterium]|nr:Polyhydroxyalkanoate synthase [Rhodospirillales bacterium]
MLDASLGRTILANFDAFLTGLERYRAHPYRRALSDPPAAWAEGATSLLDHGGTGPLLVMVPSLINRGYVLDLAEENSLARWLSTEGLRVLRLEWGAPGADERGYDVAAYVLRLERALEALGEPVHLLGYCMGGLLTVAAAIRAPIRVRSLSLLAVPWDFHADAPDRARTLASIHAAMAPLLDRLGVMPLDLIQALFAWLDPLGSARKFSKFGAMPGDSAQAHAFVALEDWLNDGVELTPGVAADGMACWYGDNDPVHGRWQVDGEAIDARHVKARSLLLVPQGDRIVPPGSANALAAQLPDAAVISPPLGHIGMVVGSRARRATWEPLAKWLREGELG